MRVKKSKLVFYIKKYRVLWGWLTLWTYIVAFPVTIIVFPDNSMWLALLVTFTGFTGTLMALADLLVNAEEAAKKDPEME
jgi:hypothetical protein